jgi:hypothetical protein
MTHHDALSPRAHGGHGSAASVFIATNDGAYVSAAAVARIERHGGHGHALFDLDGCALGITHMLDRTIVSVFPAALGWEQLYADTETPAVHGEPVVAFALMLDGQVRPLVPSDLCGMSSDEVALRRIGDPRVFVDQDGVFADADEWLADCCKRAIR